MKAGNCDPRPCKKRPPASHHRVYLPFSWRAARSFWCTLISEAYFDGYTESEGHAIGVVRVVVVIVAVAVHIAEVRCVVSRTKPPIVSRL